MTSFYDDEILVGLKKSEAIYAKVAALSEYIFNEEHLSNRESYLKELEFLLRLQPTETHLRKVQCREFWFPWFLF